MKYSEIALITITHGPWANQPTDFRMPKTQNFGSLKNLKKICNPSLVHNKQLLLQQIDHKVPSYASFCLFLVKKKQLWAHF